MMSRRIPEAAIWAAFIVVAVSVAVALGMIVGVKSSEPKSGPVQWSGWTRTAEHGAAEVRFTPVSESPAVARSAAEPAAVCSALALYGVVGQIDCSLSESRAAELFDVSDTNNLRICISPTLVPGFDLDWEGAQITDGVPSVPVPTNEVLGMVCYKRRSTNAVCRAKDLIDGIKVPVVIDADMAYAASRHDAILPDGRVSPGLIFIRYEVSADGVLLAKGILPQAFRPRLGFWDGLKIWYRRVVARPFYQNFIKESAPGHPRWHYLRDGLVITLEVALCSVILGAIIGFIVAVIRSTHDKHGRLKILNAVAKVYLTVIRGTPMTVQLMIAYFVIFATSDNKTLVAIMAFGFNSGAYVAEIMRAGITSIDNGQMEAGRSLGLSYIGTLRHIILPQAVRNVLPALGNEFIVLLKDTSIASFIALSDLSKGAAIIQSQTYEFFMPWIMVACVYLTLVMFFTWLLGKLERRLDKNG